MTTSERFVMPPHQMRPRRIINARMDQNIHLVWLDSSIDGNSNQDYHYLINSLREVFLTVNTFINANDCIDFTSKIQEKTFMVVSDEFTQSVIPIVQAVPQVNYIYIFSHNDLQNEMWPKEWSKVSGLYTDIKLLCEALIHATQRCDHNSFLISFMKKTDAIVNTNLDTLNLSFMFTKILKEILLTMDFDEGHMKDFFTYCREQFSDNNVELKNIDMVETEYGSHEPIWWYTYDCFLYFMLNRALRTMDVDLITKMGFFVRDLHNHITKLHSEQYNRQKHSNSFVVYRGQSVSQADFAQLKSNQGDVIAFNNFLSTSQNADVSLNFARRAIATFQSVGVLFIITIDPSISATPFANVENASYYEREEEILFSMQSVFRIGQMQRIERDDRLWQVELTLTGTNDSQLQASMIRMQDETDDSRQWFRLGALMTNMRQFSKAEQVYKKLLDRTSDTRKKAEIDYFLACIKDEQGEYEKAIGLYEKSLETVQSLSTVDDVNRSNIHYNLGNIYVKMDSYLKALSHFEKALKIRQTLHPENHSLLLVSYFKTATVLQNLHRYKEAVEHVSQAVAIVSRNALIENCEMQTIEKQIQDFLATTLSKDEIEKIELKQ